MQVLKRLRELREDHDLLQKDVANYLKTSPQYYQKYESGIRPIPVDRLILLAELYGTSVDYLLGRTNCMDPYPDKKKK